MAENGVSNCKIERNFLNGGSGELVVIWYLVNREVSLFTHIFFIRNPFIRNSTQILEKVRNYTHFLEMIRNFEYSGQTLKKLRMEFFSKKLSFPSEFVQCSA